MKVTVLSGTTVTAEEIKIRLTKHLPAVSEHVLEYLSDKPDSEIKRFKKAQNIKEILAYPIEDVVVAYDITIALREAKFNKCKEIAKKIITFGLANKDAFKGVKTFKDILLVIVGLFVDGKIRVGK